MNRTRSGVITGGFFALVAIGAFLLLFRRGGVSRFRRTGPVVPWWLRSLVTIGLLIMFVVIALLVFGRRPHTDQTKPADHVAKQAQEAASSQHGSSGPSGLPITFYVGAVLAVAAVVVGAARSPRRTVGVCPPRP